MELVSLLTAANNHPRMVSVQVCSPFRYDVDDVEWWIIFNMEHDKSVTFKRVSLSEAAADAAIYLAALPRTLMPEQEEYAGMGMS